MQLSYQARFKEILKRAYFLYISLVEHEKILEIWGNISLESCLFDKVDYVVLYIHSRKVQMVVYLYTIHTSECNIFVTL